MSYDMSQFYQIFFAEAAEHLESMESLLLALDHQHPDREQLNAVFRAAHSIKGSAGTFGFGDMADLTHVLEGLLDKVRKGELPVGNALVDACLEARDVLGGQLATHRDGAPADPAAAAAVATRLAALATGDAASAIGAPSTASADAAVFEFVCDAPEAGQPAVLEMLCEELADFGTVSVERHATSSMAPWRLRIENCRDAAAAGDVIAFVAHDVSVLPAGAATGDASWGLFDEPATLPAPGLDDSWGLFADEPMALPEGAAPRQVADDGAYGFFTDLPALASETSPFPRVRQTGNAASGESTIRVGVDKVDLIINQVGELVITHAMLQQIANALDPVQFERLHAGLAQLERNSRDLQASVMSVRMVPISTVFHRFPRVVRDLSGKLGKQVELKMSGENTELDRGLVERIVDPLTHLVRNSLDHGIEVPEKRLAAGKPVVGTVTLKAYQHSGTVVIEVGDDGSGLDRELILAKARERGMVVSDSLGDAEVWGLIFEAGFSTAEQVTDVSGRGVGMDVVRRNITALGGRIDIESMASIGTRMTVRLPLTLAIVDGMSVSVGSESYIVPLGYVLESLQPEPGMIKRMGGVDVLLQVRGDYLPVVVLHELFGICNAETDFCRGIMVLLEVDGRRAAMFVDALLGQHQVVIKSLETNYRKVPGVAAATIMGDGRVACILDAVALVSKADAGIAAAA
ncbi:MAG: chemotaxis protein CheW [Rhodocyclaceae bacterium]|nr:chemotaxis protein CheW [Rhodocyclaceae bacterium]